jgi:hypothetical protein
MDGIETGENKPFGGVTRLIASVTRRFEKTGPNFHKVAKNIQI